MTAPFAYRNMSVPVKFFLNSHRALTDGRAGIRCLEQHLASESFLLSDWKVIWIGVCAVLRVAVTLFQVDAKSCISREIRGEIANEWRSVALNKADHPIFWEFLRKERDNILHQYEWAAFEAWMHEDGTIDVSPKGLMSIKPDDAMNVLLMRGGHYHGRNSLELLQESADWVEERIFSAIRRAGFDPNESRTLGGFVPAPSTMIPKTILGGAVD
ncbi:MAG: hypothetical protein ABJ388_08850 [Alphaproteobacteria bacterium]